MPLGWRQVARSVYGSGHNGKAHREARLARQDLRDLQPAIRLTQEVGEGLG